MTKRFVQHHQGDRNAGYSRVMTELKEFYKFGCRGHIERATLEDRSPSSARTS